MRFQEELTSLKRQGLYRTLRVLDGVPAARLRLGARTLINFSSNNYLGLAQDPRVKKAAQGAIERYGLGGTSSRLLAGSLAVHGELENSLAAFLGFESALVFSSGYQANVGLIRALSDAGDTVLIDRSVHASVIDGCRLSGARLLVFHHNDPDNLGKLLKRARGGRHLVVTEGLFSMEGDAGALSDLSVVCLRHGALLVVDEAHAFGVLGQGRGAAEAQGVLQAVDLYVGTLSKALGSQGGFVCGREEIIDLLKNKSRSFIYTTALAPPCAAGALEALKLLQKEPRRRRKVLRLGDQMRASLQGSGFDTLSSMAQIVPVVIGDEGLAVRASRHLEERGIFAPAIRPPTVPRGESRLRFSLTADHAESDISAVTQVLKEFRA